MLSPSDQLFSRVPDEILISHILPHMSKSDLACRVALVNRRFSILCKDNSLWRSLDISPSMSFNKAKECIDSFSDNPMLTTISMITKGDTGGRLAIYVLRNCPGLTDLRVKLHPIWIEEKALLAMFEAIGEFGLSLRSLTLDLHSFVSLDHELLCRSLSRLTRLTLDGRIYSHQIKAIADGCSNLDSFDTTFIQDDEQCLAHLLQSTKSRLKVLSFNAITEPPNSTFLHLGQCRLLRKLILNNVLINEALERSGLDAILGLPLLKHLDLHMRGSKYLFSRGDFIAILEQKRPSVLSFLRLGGWFAMLDDNCLGAIVANCPNLKSFSFKTCCNVDTRCRITNNGLMVVILSEQLMELELVVCNLPTRVDFILQQQKLTSSKLRRMSLWDPHWDSFWYRQEQQPKIAERKAIRILQMMPSLEVLESGKAILRRDDLNTAQ